MRLLKKIARKTFHNLPLKVKHKFVLKSMIFRTLRPFLSHTEAYKAWKFGQIERKYGYTYLEKIKNLLYGLNEKKISCENIKLVENFGITRCIINTVEAGGTKYYLKRSIATHKYNHLTIVYNPLLKVMDIYNETGDVLYSYKINLKDFKSYLAKDTISNLVISSLVYYEDCDDFINNIIALKRQCNFNLETLIHDYYMVCPSYNLLNSQKHFCNLPQLEVCNQCLKKNELSVYKNIKIIDWRERWYRLLITSDIITVFSNSSKEILLKAYSDLSHKIMVNPHNIDYCKDLKKMNIDLNSDLVLGFVGDINVVKGKEIVEKIAQQRLLDIVVIGTMRTDVKGIKMTGRFELEKLPQIIEKNKVNIFFISSIGPETFCYVADELMALDLCIVCYNIGAQYDKIRNYKKSLVLDINSDLNIQIEQIINFKKIMQETM